MSSKTATSSTFVQGSEDHPFAYRTTSVFQTDPADRSDPTYRTDAIMGKTIILQALLAAMEENLRRHQAANKQSSADATDSEARAETKWDTSGLESSYLARGHAQHFQDLAAQVEELRAFTAPDFVSRPIGAGALVEVDLGGEAMLFFLLHCGGGMELTVEGREVTVITSESPVGAALLDKQPGDSFSFRAESSGKILSVE